MKFTVFDANGYSLQSAPTMVDLLSDAHLQTHELDPATFMVLIEDGRGNMRVLSLERTIEDYVDPDQHAQKVADLSAHAKRLTKTAGWLKGVKAAGAKADEPGSP